MTLMQQYVRFTQGHIHDGHIWLWVNHALLLEQVCYLSMCMYHNDSHGVGGN